jgi:hypothetical protein
VTLLDFSGAGLVTLVASFFFTVLDACADASGMNAINANPVSITAIVVLIDPMIIRF